MADEQPKADEPPKSEGFDLDSWKEIAAHFGKDVKTVQRWEREEGLPVHRHTHGGRKDTVYASRLELDAWRKSRAPRVDATQDGTSQLAFPSRGKLVRWALAGLAILLILTIAGFWMFTRSGQPTLTISTATSDQPYMARVQGTLSGTAGEVWLIVHPTETQEFWVQAPVAARGMFERSVVLGRPGEIDRGKTYEVRAVYAPREHLREGQVLNDWPMAALSTSILEVQRR